MQNFEYLRILITNVIEEHGGKTENGKLGVHGAELIVEYHDRKFIITVSEEE